MLIKCPECDLQVSDKATFCPHCGYPLQPDIKQRKPRSKNNKRRRLPNGFGQISEIKNRNLRNPFRAMVTVGKTSTGRPICKPLKPESYFPTYNDAYTDPRTTFVTMGKKSGMDEYALKEMVGHTIQDITESTYTVRDLEWLREDIEKIK